MVRILLFLLLCVGLVSLPLKAQPLSEVRKQLEVALEHRPQFNQQKEHRIDSLRVQLSERNPAERQFALLTAIYREYYIYRFDSAMHYVNQAALLAEKEGRESWKSQTSIQRAYLLTTGGYFREAELTLREVPRQSLPAEQLVGYYAAFEWLYSMWAEYSDDNVYAPAYYKKEMAYQDSLIQTLPSGSPYHTYWQAENCYRQGRYAEAEAYYRKALEGLPVNVRLYAMCTYGIAMVSERFKRWEEYERYLMLAAISDQSCPLKENLALQQLAFFIYHHHNDETARANRYLNIALEDAAFYNNRLRLLEISRKFPDITLSYQQENERQNNLLCWALFFISLLLLALLAAVVLIARQIRQVRAAREVSQQQNEHLNTLNRALSETSMLREQYVALFMELCAAYITKLKQFQTLVSRKVKAGQADDLLKQTNVARLSEGDAKEFFQNFDASFLKLYPDFIGQFNRLLRADAQIVPRRGELLNTELRIFALLRMGITDSSKMATLLFLSPQTIYNHRSAVRAKALDRENFESQVAALGQLSAENGTS